MGVKLLVQPTDMLEEAAERQTRSETSQIPAA